MAALSVEDVTTDNKIVSSVVEDVATDMAVLGLLVIENGESSNAITIITIHTPFRNLRV